MKIVDGKGRVELHDENSMRRVLALNGEVINEETLSVCMLMIFFLYLNIVVSYPQESILENNHVYFSIFFYMQ